MKGIQIYLQSKGYDLAIDGVIGNQTKKALTEFIQFTFRVKGYQYPSKGLVFIRTDKKLTNTFDDFVVLIKDGQAHTVAPCSTTAGKYWIQNPITHGGITGTAIAIEQQVLKSHTFVFRSDWNTLWLKMPYFQQTKPIEIYRDGNKDLNLNEGKTYKGLFGINMHRGGLGSFIDRWSAGCPVVPDKYWREIIRHFYNGEVIDFNLI
jgi:peptidoglycan hydrolase-like protein with peptidoglycan-binding domain